VTALPNIREPSGDECNIASFWDVLRERVRGWEDGIRSTDPPEDTRALLPEVRFHVRSLEGLRGGDQTGYSDYLRPADLIEDVDE